MTRRAVLAALAWPLAACGTARHRPARSPASRGSVRLEVVVTGVRGTKGMVRGALFASAEGFPGEHERARFRAETPAREGAVLLFEDVPAGEYALAVLHDADGDGRLARNAFGVPREGYAFSGTSGMVPRFDTAVVTLVPPLGRIGLRLTYLR
jgi:uncharacterized protein (DUF2141 family)